jgi:hypothetical protein
MDIPKSVLDEFRGRGLLTNIFYLFREVGVSYSEFLEMPIPAIIAMLDELKKHGEREAKANKRR